MFKYIFHKIAVLIRWCSIWITRILRFLGHDIWFLNQKDFSRWKAILIKDLQTIIVMLRTFTDQKISYQVTALAYRSMLAVVPAIAIGFYLTDGLGLRDKFAAILQNNLLSDEPIAEVLMNAADKIVVTAESGLFGFISMASFTWIVLSLMISVRQVFNNVWKVEKERRFLRMIGIIIGITILSPFVVMIFFTGSVVYSHVLDLVFPSSFMFSEHLKSFMSWLMFAGATILIMSTMYKYIPGTKVHSRCAFKAAVVSGLAFTGVQYLYLETQVMVAKQSAVYGVLAALPLFMIWLNLGWTIILYGAELSYAFQNVNKEADLTRRLRLQNNTEL